MTTRGEINSNFYQIVNVDGNGAPTSVKTQYITSGNVDNAIHANVADVANSVSVSNVVGIGNIAVLNLDGNSGNILYGNGVFSTVPNVSNVANANFANFAGTAFNVSGSNVSGTVANANYSAYAGNANVAAVANSVAVANVSGIGNIATINLDGNISNVLHGDGSFGPEAGNLNANYANFAGQVVDATQSNITAVGTLSNLSVSGNITSGNANLGNLVIANFFSGDGSLLSNINGSNVSNVANANYANFANVANVANSVAVGNVSGIGNIATINLDGSSSNVLFGNGVFAPESTSIANANYANFAGNLINGTSNVSIPVANGNVNISTNGVANIAQFDTNGALFLYPTTSSINALRVTSFGNPISGDVSRIASSRARGNLTTPLSVQPSDRVMRLLAFAYNGAGYQTSSVATFNAQVDASYTANGANIPLGWNMSVNDTNGGVNNQTKTHLFYSNGNVSFANSVFVTDNLSVTGNITGNTITGNLSILANGTSNISIPTANGNILISTAGNANIIDIWAQGVLNIKPPPQGPLNAIRIDTYGRSGNVGAQRISSFRYRGNSTTPLSVQPGDSTMEILTLGYNGAGAQTNSVAIIRGVVDSSYTANAANIPIGWQVIVNDTNGGVNNQSKTHNFYSNGTVNFANNISVSGDGNISGTNISATGVLNGNTGSMLNQLNVGNNGATSSQVFITGDKTINSQFRIAGSPFTSIMDNVDPTTGYSPFFFNTYENSNTFIPPSRYFRARGTEASPTAVTTNDVVQISSYAVYADSGNTYKDVINTSVVVTSNDGVGNVAGDYVIQGFNANSRLSITANTIANNISINSNNFMKLSFYTAANLTAVTGQLGWIAAVTNSTPGGRIAYWDTTNNRWSYIADDSAV
jgi:hypothetical protein